MSLANIKARWQEADNSEWYTTEKLKCSVCGGEPTKALELRHEDGEQVVVCCFDDKSGKCYRMAMNILFATTTENHILSSLVVKREISQDTTAVRREPVGLSKRYQVMKRDGFQCVLCGAGGRDANLEIDHIIPVAKGGNSRMSNLQTLCFKCNRGKRDSE